MTKKWQLQEAKNKFSQVVNEALVKGPQVVTRRGEEVVVIISKEEYGCLKKSQPNLSEFFRQSPLVGIELDLERDRTYPRDVEL
ncbi:MAG: type II toxin-antitoxin system Phd/YefM family antitoxin [Chloroflexota bacterium]|nr:type II toxin-antitoxin system Phd/YefM family antitoxin [Chloroflexota bacterium]